jgi:hypothetical protein
MTGISLVGYSGSLVKDTVKEKVGDVLSRAIGDLSSPQGFDILHPGLAEKPEATKALIGQVRGLITKTSTILITTLHRRPLCPICASVVRAFQHLSCI